MVHMSHVSKYKLDKILSTLEELKREVSRVKEKLEEAPPYGSDEWWMWSIQKSQEDYTAGKYKSFNSVGELQKHLDSLK